MCGFRRPYSCGAAGAFPPLTLPPILDWRFWIGFANLKSKIENLKRWRSGGVARHLFPLHPSAANDLMRSLSSFLVLIFAIRQLEVDGNFYPSFHRRVAGAGGRKAPVLHRSNCRLVQRRVARAAIHFD